MKEQITKFDLADAFKALDDIAAPSVKGIRASRMDLSEATKRVDRLSMLVEDYYDVQDQGDLEQANNDMQADVAKAKLAKIEKIVDLDAETPEDIQPSYVGKTIIQCPQCMTLFYKDAADIEKSVEDPETVNVGEICQHCGNDSGYTLIGKVAEETLEEIPSEEPAAEEAPAEEPTEEPAAEEVPVEETPAEEETTEVELPELDFGAEEETTKQESLHNSKFLKKAAKDIMNTEFHSENLTLNEDLDKDMDQFNAYIDYLQNMLKQDEEALERAKKMKDNELAVQIIEKRIAADKEDLEAALPQVVKDKQNEEELPTMEEVTETEEATETSVEEPVKQESLAEGKIGDAIANSINSFTQRKDTKQMEKLLAAAKADPSRIKDLEAKRDTKKYFKDFTVVYSKENKKYQKNFGEDLTTAEEEAVKNYSKNGQRKICYLIATTRTEIKNITIEDTTIDTLAIPGGTKIVFQKYVDGKLVDDYYAAQVKELQATINEKAKEEIQKRAAQKQQEEQNAAKEEEEINNNLTNMDIEAADENTSTEEPASEEVSTEETVKETPAKEEAPAEEEAIDKTKVGMILWLTNDFYNKDVTKLSDEEKAVLDTALKQGKVAKSSDGSYEWAGDEKQESLHNSKFLKNAEKDVMNTEFHSDNLSLNEARTAKEIKYNTYTEIMWALTGGKKIKDELGRTRLSGGPYAVPDTGLNYKTNSLKVYGENEAALQPAIDIANQFSKATSEIKFDNYISGPRKYWIEIQLDPEDFEDGEFEESVNRSKMDDYDMIRAGISEHRTINEAAEDAATVDTNLDKLIDTPEYKEPVNDAEIRAILANSVDESIKKCELDTATDIHDKAMNECISSYLNEVYSNVENFITTSCNICENKVILEGIINFKSGKSKPTTFELKATNNSMLEGYNRDLGGEQSNFKVKYVLESGKMIYPRAMSYSYKINNQLVEGLIKK